MKTRINKKTDLGVTGIRINLVKILEKQFLEILNNKDGPVFCKISGSAAMGIS